MLPEKLFDLYAAFQECEEDSDSNKLESWCYKHQGGVNGDVIEKELDSSRKKLNNNNLGSPLYIACVSNSAEAVRILLCLGADPNYIHPDHGDSPLLHCSSSGYTDCLRFLLANLRLNARDAATVDRKIFLDQGLPQYEEGGKSPLHLAASHAHVDAIQLLLCSKDGQYWLRCFDSFGRSVLQASLDEIALSKEGTPKQNDLRTLVLLLCRYLKEDPVKVLATLSSKEDAKKAEIERNRVLRERCLRAQLSRKCYNIQST